MNPTMRAEPTIAPEIFSHYIQLYTIKQEKRKILENSVPYSKKNCIP